MRVTRTLLGVAGGLLVGFHGWLLASQFMDGQLAEPWLVVRWIAAALLVGTLVALKRRGHGVFSRRSVAVWVLAALLHGPAVVGHYADGTYNAVLPESVATLILQVAAATTTLAVVVTFIGLVGLARRDRQFAFAGLDAAAPAGCLSGSAPPPFAPRPPPAA